jgi:hypothetical protein
MINVSDGAKQKILEIMQKNPGSYYRVVFEGFG